MVLNRKAELLMFLCSVREILIVMTYLCECKCSIFDYGLLHSVSGCENDRGVASEIICRVHHLGSWSVSWPRVANAMFRSWEMFCTWGGFVNTHMGCPGRKRIWCTLELPESHWWYFEYSEVHVLYYVE